MRRWQRCRGWRSCHRCRRCRKCCKCRKWREVSDLHTRRTAPKGLASLGAVLFCDLCGCFDAHFTPNLTGASALCGNWFFGQARPLGWGTDSGAWNARRLARGSRGPCSFVVAGHRVVPLFSRLVWAIFSAGFSIASFRFSLDLLCNEKSRPAPIVRLTAKAQWTSGLRQVQADQKRRPR